MAKKKNLLIAAAALLLLLVLVYAFRTSILTGVADYLVIDDKLQPADLIFLLNGDYNTRPFRAGELYKQGLAPAIAIVRCEDFPAVQMGLIPNDTDISVGVMEKLGIPADKIIILPFSGGVTSTFDEATALKQYVEANNLHKIIIVTSSFHTRRARWIFNRELAGLPFTLEMAAAPDPGFNQTNWWQSENGLIMLNNEYVKLIYYFFKYR